MDAGRDDLARAERARWCHYPDVQLFEDIARVAERGLIDLIFGDRHKIEHMRARSRTRFVTAWPGRAWI